MTTEELSHRLEIQQLVYRYCRAVDRRDFKLLAELYADDSTDEHGGMFSGSGKEYVEWVSGLLENAGHTSHQVLNHLIEIDTNNGDYAEGEVYSMNVHIMQNEAGEAVNLTTGTRYLDKYTRTEKGWQFLHRKTVGDYTLSLPVPSDSLATNIREGTPVGAAKTEDPSHGYFRLITFNDC